MRRFGAHPWITAWMRRYGWRLDRRLLRLTGGRFSLNGPSVLLLHTTGRRSGLPRETPVIYVRDGEDFLVTSEDFGQQRPAGWPLNLAANPEAEVTIGRLSIPVRARLLSETEADGCWARLVEVCPAHEIYWRRSGRRHVYRLTPI
jgi:deazaflavin-dependent oxidoreductase (nitroreductase family)